VLLVLKHGPYGRRFARLLSLGGFLRHMRITARYNEQIMDSDPVGIVDYIYTDEKRIDNVFQQLSGPVKYDKVPTLAVEISLLGPKASGSQTRPSRPFSTHEKIAQLMNHKDLPLIKLDRNIQAYDFYETIGVGPRIDYALLRMTATRIRIPKSVSSDPEFNGLTIWVERKPDGQGVKHFYLVEDAANSAGEYWGSGMTGLWTLLQELSGQHSKLLEGIPEQDDRFEGIRGPAYRKSGLSSDPDFQTLFMSFQKDGQVSASAEMFETRDGQIIVDGDVVYRFCDLAEADSTRIGLCRDPVLELGRRVFTKPIEFWRGHGGKVGYTREIDALVLLRKVWSEMSLEWGNVFAIGYPLFIASAPSPFF
jgi:hypothetical protein